MTGLSSEDGLDTTLAADDAAGRVDDRPDRLVPGSEVGRYILLSELGAGAMGVVFAAYDPKLDRKVALKILKPRGGDRGSSRGRLQREAQALAKLDHPNVVAVHDVGTHEDRVFVAMEFVEGQTLGAWMESAPAMSTGSSARAGASGGEAPVMLWPWREVLEVFVQAGRGLWAAHEAGLVHRDFKPDNVMMSEGGRVRVMDFGLARIDDGELSGATEPGAAVGSLTQTGALLGTPAYMSLEQFAGGQVDARSDQFSFCVALHEALYGERPFSGETVGVLVAALTKGVVRGPTRGAHVPGWVRAVVLRGLAPQPEDRFESMQALLDALAADPVARRRRLAVRLGLGLALAAGSWGVISLSGTVEQREATIKKQESELELKNAELEEQLAVQARLLSVQRGLRARALVGTGNEAEALLLGVQAVGAYASAWAEAPREAVMGLEQVLAHDPVMVVSSHVLEGHEDYVTYLVYSPDGARLATASHDGHVRIWDTVRAQVLADIGGHEGKVSHVEFSPDGTRLATTSTDTRARIWDAESGELLATLGGHEAPLHTLRFSPDGARLATAGLERSVKIWDVQTGGLLFTLAGDSERMVYDLVYTPDSARLVTAGADATGRVWDAKTGRLLLTLVGHERPISALAVSPDGARVVTASEDRRARIWALETGELVTTLEGHQHQISRVAYSPDGTRLTTVSWDATGRIYDSATGELVATLEGGHGSGIASLAYAPDGSSIATGSFGGNVAVWDAETGEPRARLRGHRADVWSLAFAPDGRQLATASVDHSARLWDLGDARVAVLEGPETNVANYVYSPDHTRLATISTDGKVRVWTGQTGELVHVLDEGEGDRLVSIAYSRDGSQLVAIGQGRLRSWDAHTGVQRSTTRLGDRDLAAGVGFSPAGTQLYVSEARRVRNLDARTHELLATIEYEQRFSWKAYSPDDARLAIATSTSAVQLWDPRTGERIAELEMPGDKISKAFYSRDATQLVTVSANAGIRIWDADSLAPRVDLQSSHNTAHVAYSPDGAHIAGTSGPDGVRVWDAKTGEALMHIEPEASETGTGRAMYSPDGSRLAVRTNGSLRIHDSATGERLVSIDRLLIGHFEFWPDGTWLTTVDSNHALEVWDAETGESKTRERVGVVREDGSIDWPIPPHELTRLGCGRLRVFDHSDPEAQDVCAPLLGD